MMPTAPRVCGITVPRTGMESVAHGTGQGLQQGRKRRKIHLVVYVSSKYIISVHLKLAWWP